MVMHATGRWLPAPPATEDTQMPIDKFKRETLTIDSVIEDGFDITPADNTELNTVTRAIYIDRAQVPTRVNWIAP